LTSNVRRGRLSQADVGAILEQIDPYDVALAKPATVSELSDLVAFAAEHQLSAYDAAYILLALSLGAKLATLDNAMRRAAARLGVEVLPA
jgi:predicted nucleic acid-binding protein